MYFSQEIEFKEDFPLSGKILYEMLINKANSDLKEYLESWKATGLWITWMRSPAFKIVWENADKVFETLTKYIEEIWEPYYDDVETTFEEPKFNK